VQVSGLSGTGFVPSGIETHNGGYNDIFIEDRRWATEYVVDVSAQVGARGTFQTIQGAIDAAVTAGGNASILVRPGTYTEDLTFHAGIDVLGFAASGFGSLVTVIGNHTYADIGECIVQDIAFNATSGDLFTINPATPGLSIFALKSCRNNNAGGRGTVVNATGGAIGIYLELQCVSTVSTQAIVATGLTRVLLSASNFTNTTVAEPLITVNDIAEVIVFSGAHLDSLGDVINILSATAKVQVHGTDVNTQVLAPNGAFIRFIAAGTAIAVHDTVNTRGSVNNVIGAGTYQYADIVNYGSNGIDPATTQQPFDWKPYATANVTASAVRGTAAFDETQFSVTDGFVNLFSPFFAGTSVVADYTAQFTDSFISVDNTAVPRTITLPASTDNGRTFTIKDGSGGAGTNAITILSAALIDGGSQTINTNYGSIQVRFNGTTYQVY